MSPLVSFQLLYERGVSRTYSLIFMGCLYVVVLLSSWFLLPPYKIEEEDHLDEALEQEQGIAKCF